MRKYEEVASELYAIPEAEFHDLPLEDRVYIMCFTEAYNGKRSELLDILHEEGNREAARMGHEEGKVAKFLESLE